MKYLIVGLGLLVASVGYCQSEFNIPDTDPDAFTSDISEALTKGVVFFGATPAPCNTEAMNVKSRIADLEWKGDTLLIEVAFGELCCVEFDTGIAVAGDTLHLLFQPYGSWCFCSCCYHITYRILSSESKFLNYTLNGKVVFRTDEVHKEHVTKTEFHENGRKKKESHFLDDDLLMIFYFDTTETRIKTENYAHGKLVHTTE